MTGGSADGLAPETGRERVINSAECWRNATTPHHEWRAGDAAADAGPRRRRTRCERPAGDTRLCGFVSCFLQQCFPTQHRRRQRSGCWTGCSAGGCSSTIEPPLRRDRLLATHIEAAADGARAQPAPVTQRCAPDDQQGLTDNTSQPPALCKGSERAAAAKQAAGGRRRSPPNTGASHRAHACPACNQHHARPQPERRQPERDAPAAC